MSKRHIVLTLLSAALSASSPAFAQSQLDRVVSDLRSENYDTITIKRTFLGRIRVYGSGSAGVREVILNPSTGEVLRDYASSGKRERPLGGDDTRPAPPARPASAGQTPAAATPDRPTRDRPDKDRPEKDRSDKDRDPRD